MTSNAAMKQELRDAVTALTDRGLYNAAKWYHI
jgi:hypothetical protein